MIDIIKDFINNQSVLILGFGKEGQSTYNMLKKVGGYSKLDIADKLDITIQLDESHQLITGETYMDFLDCYDIVFKSPGIVLPRKPEEYNCYIASQTDIFIKNYARQIIGITGTKGKSTVSTLTNHILRATSQDVILGGNIGIPVFDIIDDITPSTIIILELSCHQLEYCYNSPAIAIFLNLFEDHLDHYGTFDNYAKAKTNIYKHQYSLDTLFCISEFSPNKEDCPSRIVHIDKNILPFDTLESIEGVTLKGTHNLINVAFVYNICKLFNIDDTQFIQALQSYTPLPHRLQFIGTKNEVDYYDDSISTTVESTISAINSIPNADTILIGGMDRTIDYSNLVTFLLDSQVTNIILMYQSGHKILNMLNAANTNNHNKNIVYVDNLRMACDLAIKCSKPNTACILSPAAASYGYFKNFEERGDVFKEYVFN